MECVQDCVLDLVILDALVVLQTVQEYVIVALAHVQDNAEEHVHLHVLVDVVEIVQDFAMVIVIEVAMGIVRMVVKTGVLGVVKIVT